uniref:Metallo-beta-lactamase domain-containing protein n=1 Tax=Panagrolaimus sp. JU765 TaxID=591449 RepID=A0AC34QQ74_9BILA
MVQLARPLFLVAILLSFSSVGAATTDQLREWIIANKNALPKSAQEALNSASESDLASTILRMFGFGAEKSTTTTLTVATPTTTPKSGVKVSERDVCPFNADPLILSGEYAYCKPSSQGDCPVGTRPGARISSGNLGGNVVISIAVPGGASNNGNLMKNAKPLSWSTVTAGRPTTRWTPAPTTTRRAPWYIKDRTPWNSAYNRVTPETRATTLPTTTAKASTPAVKPTVAISTAKPVNPWAKLWTTTPPTRTAVNVSVLQAGSMRALQDGQMEMVGAITLVNDNGMRVLVDTGSSADTERLLQSLSKEKATLDDIETVVITHGHPGHMGNMNFFGQKPILFHSMEYIGRHVTPTELRERPYRKLSNNVEVWKTPGHTQHDLSVLVHNVQGYGSMAIVGDLIPSEGFISDNVDAMSSEGVWDTAIKRQNANLIICMADWIVPGHGSPFRVLPQYRQKAGCTRLLAQRHILNAAA